MNFLVPCPACEKKLSVSSAQAGQPIRCECGNQFEAPTMGQMRLLEPVAPNRVAESTWNRRKGLAFLGSAILLLAVIAAGGLYLSLPSGVTAADIRTEIESLDPAETYIRYQALRIAAPVESPSGQVVLGPVQPLIQGNFDPYFRKFMAIEGIVQAQQIEARRKRLMYWLPLVGVVAAIGLGLALSSLLVHTGPSKSRGARRRAVGASSQSG